jgi:uncharacterized protein YdaU (DUF1376 family)
MTDLRALPYYKWFWQDWRANRKTQRMGYVERGLYRELLDECWVEGSIPNDIAILAEICGCPKDVMANAWQVLESCFELLEGKYINKKMESMRTEKDAERLMKSKSGKKGGVSKSLNLKPKKASAKQVVASARQVLAPANIGEERRGEESLCLSQDKKTLYSSNFELFWKVYPEKKGKGGAWASWKKINPDSVLVNQILKSVDFYKESKRVKDGFIKNPQTWLNQRCWEDEDANFVDKSNLAPEWRVG